MPMKSDLRGSVMRKLDGARHGALMRWRTTDRGPAYADQPPGWENMHGAQRLTLTPTPLRQMHSFKLP